MRRTVAGTASVALVFAVASLVEAEQPSLVPCDELPASVAALAPKPEIDAFGIAPAAFVAVAAIRPPEAEGRSVLRVAREAESPRVVQLAGRVLGLAVASDGKFAYAVVRTVDRKGVLRGVELVRVDLATARTTGNAVLPAGARGVAIGDDGRTLLVASRDEIRTFRLPGLESGPLYRAPGDNVGVAPIAGSFYVLLAQPRRIVLANLAAPQGREGLALSDAVEAPAPLSGMMASAGDAGPIALSADGPAWCVRAGALPPPPPAPEALAAPAPAEVAPAEAPPSPPPLDASAPAASAAPVPAELPQAEPAPNVEPAPGDAPAEPGTVFGMVAGPSAAEVAGIVILGPDNVLREAARVVPDGQGRFRAPGLPAGSYRIVAAGRGGRVLICDPPYMTVRVGSNGAVEAPVLKVVRAQ